MAWDYDKSLERIEAHLDGMGKIEVKQLVREANLDALLTETVCRDIYGAHVYVEILGVAALASADDFGTSTDYKRLIQAVHVYQREVSRIVEGSSMFDAVRVHFQGTKLHSLFYRPIEDGEELAAKAVLLALVLREFVRSVFNPAYPAYSDFDIAAGIDLGSAIGTRNGTKGDRELLFLGAPANHAAKIMSSAGRLLLTEAVYDALPDDLQALCSEVGDSVYRLRPVEGEDLGELLEERGIEWDVEESAERVRKDKERFPLSLISYGSATAKIDLDDLSIYNNKRVLAATLFGDVAGFTAYIDAAETEEERQEALRVFHAIRKEQARVIRDDYPGLRVQFQGDRVQGLFHLPEDDGAKIAETAIEAAVGLQSSMEHTVKHCLPEAKDLHLAVGVDLGTTLVSKLGTRGHRDRICIGEAVGGAESNEERCGGGMIGVSKAVCGLLPEDLGKHFSWNAEAGCYAADGLTADKVELAGEAAKVYASGASLYMGVADGGVSVTRREKPGTKPVKPPRSYAP
jgi:class 3 adenylate cyclase